MTRSRLWLKIRKSATGLLSTKANFRIAASAPPMPGERRGCAIVPDRADQGTGEAGQPPGLVLREQEIGDADIGHGADGADQAKAEQAEHEFAAGEAPVA